jgi:hypothetical protein
MWVTHAVWLVYGQNESLEGIPALTGMRCAATPVCRFNFFHFFCVGATGCYAHKKK